MRQFILLTACFAGAALAQPAGTGQFLLRIEPTRTGFTLQNMTPEEGKLAGAHAQYLKSLLDSGKMTLAAQVFDPKGLWGIVIVNAADRETARALLDADPMIKGNTFRGEVLPVRVVFEKPAEPPSPGVAVDAKILESYCGTYKSEQMPLEIKAFVKDGRLYFQATGQPEFPMKAVSPTKFEFTQAGIVVEFDSASSFTIKQGGVGRLFKKVVEP
jgi:uncharacterized protein YciI